MTITLRWYYWYKNFWDELLLFWLLTYIQKNYQFDAIVIETENTTRLKKRFDNNKWLLHRTWLDVNKLSLKKTWFFNNSRWLLFLWWWEVLTDSRKFPYNWWTYLFKHSFSILFWRYILVWWIWTIGSKLTTILYNILLKRARMIIVRDSNSYSIVRQYSQNVIQYHDFALDVLPQVESITASSRYVVVNCNAHIYNDDSIEKINNLYKECLQNNSKVYFVPWSCWWDDSDIDIYLLLKKKFPLMELFERHKHTLEETIKFISWAEKWIAARLHLLIVMKFYWVSFTSLVYQEKINHILHDMSK